MRGCLFLGLKKAKSKKFAKKVIQKNIKKSKTTDSIVPHSSPDQIQTTAHVREAPPDQAFPLCHYNPAALLSLVFRFILDFYNKSVYY